ncbi:MAG: hypothetical protein ACREQA_13225 [Candidatus Binatia bacterium]
MKYKAKHIFYGGILIANGMMLLLLNRWPYHHPKSLSTHHHSHVNEVGNKKLYQFIQKDSKDIFRNEDALFSYVKKFGLNQTIARLHELAPLYGDCHQPAHQAGRLAYKVHSTEAFRSVTSECHAGGFHGAIEAYFSEHGTKNLSKDVKVICRSELNKFYTHQCIHGIGHGLMAAANYELFVALKNCDLLGERQGSCWSGVFMENIVGGLAGHEGHAMRSTKYLSDDPHYPCTVVDEKYKSSCYLLQTSRMMQLFSSDFSKVASACSEAPRNYRRVCFESMGRDVGGVHRGNPAAAIESCSGAPRGELRIGCLAGAVQDEFWDPAGQDNALNFCKHLEHKAEKDACYSTIFSRAPQILPSKEDLRSFCSKAEALYRGSCDRIAS